jgi:2-polyprenyl-6-methoxyphenol hydroxylase-like FAD-dependent oxidoreductase
VVGETPFAQADCRWGFQASLLQYRTEAILTAHLAVRGVEVERAVDVTAVKSGDDHVSVVLRRSDGTPETVEAGWVVGAGGAGSITRHSMAETLQGATYPGTALAGDVKVRGNVPRDGGALVATPHGYVLLAALPDERWITFIGTLNEDEERQLSLDCSLGGIAVAHPRAGSGHDALASDARRLVRR